MEHVHGRVQAAQAVVRVLVQVRAVLHVLLTARVPAPVVVQAVAPERAQEHAQAVLVRVQEAVLVAAPVLVLAAPDALARPKRCGYGSFSKRFRCSCPEA